MALPAFIAENVRLAPFTTFGAGGAARFFSRPADADEVAETFRFAEKAGLPVLALGGGSNLLVADAGVEAVVARLSDAGEFGAVREEPDGVWRVGAAVSLSALVAAAIRRGRAGLVPLSGIPGRVGGAAAMNAGAGGVGLGDFIRGAEAFSPDGARKALGASELEFSYRNSNLGGLIATAFRMEFPGGGDPEQLEAAARAVRERKQSTQPVGRPSAGCVFKNPPGASAGALLDAAGCKGLSVGGARVSDVHANFIVTGGPGTATAADIAALARLMRERVFAAAGVELETEIILWGEGLHA